MKTDLPTPPAMGMTRTEMESAARERLLEAVLSELGDRRPEEIDLSKLLSEVGTSQDDFAAEYGDLRDCLSVAYEHLTTRLDDAVRAGCRLGATPPVQAGDWAEGVCHGLEALLAELAAAPNLARALIRGYPSLGAQEHARYQAFAESFGPMLTEGRQFAESEEELPRELEMLAVGAAEAILFEEIEAGRAGELPTLLPAILFSLLVPFLGPVIAGEEMDKAQMQS